MGENAACRSISDILIFKVCFDEPGWERGQKIFFDQLALQYPQVWMVILVQLKLLSECKKQNSISQISQCNLFNGTDLTERDPGLRCSIAEEVANGREVAECTNKLQVSKATVHIAICEARFHVLWAPIQLLPENVPENVPELGKSLENIFGKILIQMDFQKISRKFSRNSFRR